jgi:hypothetical protein
MFDGLYKKLLLEYTEKEADALYDLIKKQYRSRRIVMTNSSEFVPKSFEQKSASVSAMHTVFSKPTGTWYARGEEWMRFLLGEWQSALTKYSHAFMIDIDYTSMLRINTEKKMDEFEKRWVNQIEGSYLYGIDWTEVAKQYKGIEIIPYFWNYRHQSKGNWYYTWDIASGCIWDASAIKGFKEIPSASTPY